MAAIKPRIIRVNTVDLDPSVSPYFNAIGERAGSLLPGEFMPWDPETRRLLVAMPCAAPVPAAVALEEYGRLELVVDGAQRVKLSEHPNMITRDGEDRNYIRGFPVCLPMSVFRDDLQGDIHTFELYLDGERLVGPLRVMVHDDSTGAVYESIEAGPGPRQLTFTVRRTEQLLQVAITRTDVAFGDVVAAEQVMPDGSVEPLVYIKDGKHGLPVLHHLGDVPVLYEGFVTGFRGHPFFGDTIYRLTLEKSSTGFAMANRGGVTLARACRADVAVA